jgi:serine O-acetyltransferase
MNPLPLYRVSHWLYTHRLKRLARAIYRINVLLSGCSIPPQVVMGEDCKFPDYGIGVVLNGNVRLGSRVTVLPNVVIGQNVRRLGEVSTVRVCIDDDVVIGTGAKIIASGDLVIGARSVVGANAVVRKSVPADCTAVGIPARIIPHEGDISG